MWWVVRRTLAVAFKVGNPQVIRDRNVTIWDLTILQTLEDKTTLSDLKGLKRKYQFSWATWSLLTHSCMSWTITEFETIVILSKQLPETKVENCQSKDAAGITVTVTVQQIYLNQWSHISVAKNYSCNISCSILFTRRVDLFLAQSYL